MTLEVTHNIFIRLCHTMDSWQEWDVSWKSCLMVSIKANFFSLKIHSRKNCEMSNHLISNLLSHSQEQEETSRFKYKTLFVSYYFSIEKADEKNLKIYFKIDGQKTVQVIVNFTKLHSSLQRSILILIKCFLRPRVKFAKMKKSTCYQFQNTFWPQKNWKAKQTTLNMKK